MVEIQVCRARISTFILKHYFKSKCNPRVLGSNNRFREDSNFLFSLFSIMVCFYFFMLVTVVNLETFNKFKTMALKLSRYEEM